MKKLRILLTFDHELPLGTLNTNFNNALFSPACRVMLLAKELNVPVNFFTDILCAVRYKDRNFNGFYKPYSAQLKQALAEGHDVQLHLHPHWLTSEYTDGNFIPSSDFTLSCFQHKIYPENISGIVEKGVSSLTSICKEAFHAYRCIAYRGGGYNLSPASSDIFSALYSNGIRFDSSVCKGFYFKSALSEVDYSNMPKMPNWYINSAGEFKKPANSGILEIPIAGKPKGIFEMPTSFKLKKYKSRTAADHGKQIHAGKPADLAGKIKQMLSSRTLNFDNFTYSEKYLLKILNYNMKKYSNYETVVLCTIAHPKSMSDYSFSLMKYFVEQSRKKYGGLLEFCTYRQLYDEIY